MSYQTFDLLMGVGIIYLFWWVGERAVRKEQDREIHGE